MGSRSRSTTSLREENVQNIETRNLALSDFEGIGIGEAGRDIEIQINSVDSGVVAAAENLGTGAINLAGDVTAQAIRASERGLDRALDFGEDALDLTDITTRRAFNFGEDTTRRAFNFGEDTTRKAFSFSRDTTRRAFDFGEQAFDFGEDAFAIAEDSIRAGERGLDRSLDFSEGIFTRSLKAINDATSKAFSASGAATRTAFASTRSEASQSIEQLIKFGGIVAGLFAFGFIISRARK